MFRALLPAAALWMQPAVAQQIDDLSAALLLPQTVEVMRAEGLAYTDELAEDLFAGAPSAVWREAVDAIFDEAILLDSLLDTLEAEMTDAQIAAATAFYASAPGAEIARLELSAREALLDETVEETTVRDVGDALRDGERQAVRLTDYVARFGMIEEEVASAMTLSLAFTNGLRDGGALEGVDEATLLRDLYDRQPEIRREVTERIYAYFWLAYRPLEDDRVAEYIDYLGGAEGQALRAAFFEAFDTVYIRASRQLGLVAASQMRGSDL
ncbi:DUF2059 domain-containing protein [Salipiger sp. IMCC34102]|uniref:DUF2059 domain-containing protein n=1 Tax=Salipiger sp. IMCC34102 TaxID=2510647 RepID=UPI00101C7F35|nr:DUF2059 domain-containing protein [Salipiger sp. IMCC34102]RYH03098.1 DUF2059 domain-containing protein [Salipiger sp. IMCC34102]